MGHQAVSVCWSDYPSRGPLAGKFVDRSILHSNFTLPLIEQSLIEADVIHVHNFLLPDVTRWVRSLNASALYVYQTHSPLREGPLYVAHSGDYGFEYQRKLVVGQHWGRLFPDYLPVPNLILDTPSCRPREHGQRLRVMYSPTHSHQGRWTDKRNQALDRTLTSMAAAGAIELIQPDEPVHPHTLMQIRRTCHVTVDEISTGGFHQVSLEGLCAGTVVINRADYFARQTFAGFCDGEPPPFVYADEVTISRVLQDLANDVDATVAHQSRSVGHFRKYCDPLRLGAFFDAAYEATHAPD